MNEGHVARKPATAAANSSK